MLFSQFDASEHAPLVSRVTADTNHRVNEMSRIFGNVADLYNKRRKLLPQIARLKPSTDHLAW